MFTPQYGAPSAIETKRLADGEWEVAGYASTYDLDLGGDMVRKGAFAKSLSSGAKVRFLYGHDAKQVLGSTIDLREDEHGLHGRFKISKTSLGQDVRTLLLDGSLDSFSIGYLPKEIEVDKKDGVRHLTEVELLEVSVVSMPMQPQALVTSIKAADYAAMPLEDVLNDLTERRTSALAAVKAMSERRRSEGRKLSDRVVELLELQRQASLADADALLAVLTAPAVEPVEEKEQQSPAPPTEEPTEVEAPPAPVRTAGLVEAHLRRARLARLSRKYSDVSLPPYDPVEHLARLEVEGVLNEEPA